MASPAQDAPRPIADPSPEPDTAVGHRGDVRCEQVHVRPSLAQLWQVRRDRAQPVAQILAEQALPDHAGQVPVRRGKHADVSVDVGGAGDVAGIRKLSCADFEQVKLK